MPKALREPHARGGSAGPLVRSSIVLGTVVAAAGRDQKHPFRVDLFAIHLHMGQSCILYNNTFSCIKDQLENLTYETFLL